MNHQKYASFNTADAVPALLTIGQAIFLNNQIGVGEDARREFKIDAIVLLWV